MSFFEDQILKLTKQLYPRGRAFKMPFDGNLEKLHRALSVSEARFQEDAISILDSALPDNDNFTAEDATAWERRLGMIVNESVPLADRKLAIQRKMNHPGNIPARQSATFLERELRAAGFDVYVHENIFAGGTTKYPSELDVSGLTEFQYGDFQYGDQEYGSYWENVIINHIDESKDAEFNIPTNLRSTFFIGGETIGTFADVDEERKDEFRKLILSVKSAHLVGFLFINYV